MAIQYVITEEEMQSLIDSLKLEALRTEGHLRGQHQLSAEEMNRLNGVHGSFHYVVVRWAQAMGFKGHR